MTGHVHPRVGRPRGAKDRKPGSEARKSSQAKATEAARATSGRTAWTAGARLAQHEAKNRAAKFNPEAEARLESIARMERQPNGETPTITDALKAIDMLTSRGGWSPRMELEADVPAAGLIHVVLPGHVKPEAAA